MSLISSILQKLGLVAKSGLIIRRAFICVSCKCVGYCIRQSLLVNQIDLLPACLVYLEQWIPRAMHPTPLLFLVAFIVITPWLCNQFQPTAAKANNTTNEQNENGTTRCGNIEIPYPFWINAGPFPDDNFFVTCNYSSSSSSYVPILKKLNFELLKEVVFNSWNGKVVVKFPSFTTCEKDDNNSNKHSKSNTSRKGYWWTSPDLSKTPFGYFEQNRVASIGCDGYAALYDDRGVFVGGCSSTCSPNPPPKGLNVTGCNGYRCCQIKFNLSSYQKYSLDVRVNNVSSNCRSAFLISKDYFGNGSLIEGDATPAELSWSIIHDYSSGGGESNLFVRRLTNIIMLYFVLPSVGTILFTCLAVWLCWRWRTRSRRKEIRLRTKYFKKRVKEEASAGIAVVDHSQKTKLFTLKDLSRNTDNFSKDRILGKGGQGTVYKGMLMDGQVIAVKRSRALDDHQWKQFINEVILLSQIQHRHVVKLLGCCLETKTPMVVYEYIQNGTLSDYIYNPTSEGLLTWEMRLQIASETASAINYLHSECPTPIFHRDIKSSNILLDDKYRAKVSDFGISKAVLVDQTHLTTLVQGTLGYLDPEYFHTSQFSEKSDVYSFGVVLVELLTGKKPTQSLAINEEEEEDYLSLVEYFISSVNDSTLYKILDPKLLEGGGANEEDIVEVANIAKHCLNLRGYQRPTMKEVLMALERIRSRQSPHSSGTYTGLPSTSS